MPLAMMPTAQEVLRSARGASSHSAVARFQLPLTMSRVGDIAFQVGTQPDTLQCRQFYHALVLHKHRQDLLPLLLALKKQCAELRRKVNDLSSLSVFKYCHHLDNRHQDCMERDNKIATYSSAAFLGTWLTPAFATMETLDDALMLLLPYTLHFPSFSSDSSITCVFIPHDF